MRTNIFLVLLAACALQAAYAQEFGIVPNDGNGNYYPSVSADGNEIAYLTDESGGGSVIKVYNVSLGTTSTVSTGIPYCGRPRLSRDGHYVTYFGTAFYGSGDSTYWLVVYPVVAVENSDGTWNSPVSAIAQDTSMNTYSTLIWDTGTPEYGAQAPGISNGTIGENDWTVSFGDLIGRSNGNEWVCTSSAPNSSESEQYYTYAQLGNQVPTDIDADADTITYAYEGQIYVSGSQDTSFNADCHWPSIDAEGDLVAFDSAATGQGGVLSGSNVYILTVSGPSWLCPYYLQTGASSTGGADHPFISSDGDTVAFNLNSSHLVWDHSYTYTFPAGRGELPFFAAQCGVASSSKTTILSVNYNTSAPYAVQTASDACAFDLSYSTSGVLAGAFDTTSTSVAPHNWGSFGTGSNVLLGY